MTLMKGKGQPYSGSPKPLDVKLTGALIKKGTIPYEPAPYFTQEPSESPKEDEPRIRILKEHRSMADLSPHRAPEDFNKLREEAQQFVEKSKADAERILSEAQLKAKKLIEQSKLYAETAFKNAQREGFAKGQEDGRKAGREETSGIIHAARDTMAEVTAEIGKLTQRAEDSLAQLAIRIAERIIGSEVALNSNVVINMVKANLERVKERERVVIHVNPEDLEIVRSKRDVFSQFVPQVRSLDIESDPRVERGGCMIETNLGIVDARISTQLEAIEQAFSQQSPPPEESEEEAEEPNA